MSQDLTSFKPLKEFAREKLPQSSLLRQLILLEPDTLPRNQLAQKAVLYRKMLVEEMNR